MYKVLERIHFPSADQSARLSVPITPRDHPAITGGAYQGLPVISGHPISLLLALVLQLKLANPRKFLSWKCQ